MRCIHCFKEFKPNPRVKNQQYCGAKKCRRARRALWQRRKAATDPDYRDNQKRCQREWQERNPGYYRLYRMSHPCYVQRNRFLQEIRNNRRRKGKTDQMIAKMDSLLKPFYSRKGCIFRLIPQGAGMIAKMDSLTARLIPVASGNRTRLGKRVAYGVDCKRGPDRQKMPKVLG